MQQNCKCVSPLQCNCGGDGGVQYVLGDLNLMCMEDDQSGKGGEWEKMLQHAPAGTIGKIAPEVMHMILIASYTFTCIHVLCTHIAVF